MSESEYIPQLLTPGQLQDLHQQRLHNKRLYHYFDREGRLAWSQSNSTNYYTWYLYNTEGQIIEMGESPVNAGLACHVYTMYQYTTAEVGEIIRRCADRKNVLSLAPDPVAISATVQALPINTTPAIETQYTIINQSITPQLKAVVFNIDVHQPQYCAETVIPPQPVMAHSTATKAYQPAPIPIPPVVINVSLPENGARLPGQAIFIAQLPITPQVAGPVQPHAYPFLRQAYSCFSSQSLYQPFGAHTAYQHPQNTTATSCYRPAFLHPFTPYIAPPTPQNTS